MSKDGQRGTGWRHKRKRIAKHVSMEEGLEVEKEKMDKDKEACRMR